MDVAFGDAIAPRQAESSLDDGQTRVNGTARAVLQQEGFQRLAEVLDKVKPINALHRPRGSSAIPSG
jgi:hypothetical protein